MITYLDTYNFNGLDYSDYLDFCDVNDLEPGDENSNSFYDWLRETSGMEVDDFFSNLQYSAICCQPVTVSGTLGLWWGRPEIEPRRFDDLADAIRACMNGADDITVTLDRGQLSVDAHHHDGTNCFTIRRAGGHFWPKYLY